MEEASLVDHLTELRVRLVKSIVVIASCFILLIYFSNDIYQFLAEPLQKFLPSNSSMIATEVASPFLAPLKLTLFVSLMISMPYFFSQIWGFVAPALYKQEKNLSFSLLFSSVVLFYLGIVFTYFLILPIVFSFFTSSAPEGVLVMTDINSYLGFVLGMMFAFAIAFEIPILIFLLIWSGVSTSASLSKKRPYIIVGCFVVGMLITPPDVISQTLLAVPAWLLFELGLLISKLILESRTVTEDKKKKENRLQNSLIKGHSFREGTLMTLNISYRERFMACRLHQFKRVWSNLWKFLD